MRLRFQFCGLRWRWELESNDKCMKNGCGGMFKISTDARTGLWWSFLKTRRRKQPALAGFNSRDYDDMAGSSGSDGDDV